MGPEESLQFLWDNYCSAEAGALPEAAPLCDGSGKEPLRGACGPSQHPRPVSPDPADSGWADAS